MCAIHAILPVEHNANVQYISTSDILVMKTILNLVPMPL